MGDFVHPKVSKVICQEKKSRTKATTAIGDIVERALPGMKVMGWIGLVVPSITVLSNEQHDKTARRCQQDDTWGRKRRCENTQS